MVNIGILGNVNVGKTTILRLFVKYVKEDLINKVEGGVPCEIVKTDFSGESVQNPESAEKGTKTITPNKVVFKEVESGKNHALFAPGGDKERPVIKMGIITISRIAREIITVVAADQPLKEQFEFFDEIRHFPKSIIVTFNKWDLVKKEDREKLLNDLKEKVTEYFRKRKIEIRDFYTTCAEDEIPNSKQLNDNVCKMILDIALNSKD
ncbi:MAG: hypothetical protein ACTSVC_12360 [Promethearchaeota archaeon]